MSLRRASMGIRVGFLTGRYVGGCVSSIALGTAAGIVAFGIVDGVLFQQLHYEAPDRLVVLRERQVGGGRLFGSLPEAVGAGLAEASPSVESLGAFGFGSETRVLRTSAGAQLVEVLAVTPGLFRVLRAGTSQGVLFKTGDADQERQAVVTAEFASRIGGPGSRVLGSPLVTDRGTLTVSGVLRRGFRFPHLIGGRQPEVYTCLLLNKGAAQHSRALALARLRAGVTLSEARAEVATSSRGLYRHLFGDSTTEIYLTDMREALVGRARPANWQLLAGATLFSLIAWVNAGQLLLARFWVRRREIATMGALGSSPSRLLRQAVAEVFRISIAGMLLGLVAAAWVMPAVTAGLPAVISPLERPELDLRAFLVSVALGGATTIALVALLAPQFRRLDLRTVLNQSHGDLGARRGLRVRSILTALETGSVTVLLVVAFAVASHLWREARIRPGFDLQPVLAAKPIYPADRYSEPVERHRFVEMLASSLRTRTGILQVGLIDLEPLVGATNAGLYAATGHEHAPRSIETRTVSGDYFTAMGIPVLRGRVFGPGPGVDSSSEIVLSEAAARMLHASDIWAVRIVSETESDLRVIGVVGDIRDSNSQLTTPLIYRRAQYPDRLARTLIVRSATLGKDLVPVVQAVSASIDRDVVLKQFTMEDSLARMSSLARFTNAIAWAGSLLAMLQVALGLYGVVALVTLTRLRDAAVRFACGSTVASIRWRLIRQAGGPAATGVAAGAVAAAVLASLAPSLWPGDVVVSWRAVMLGAAVSWGLWLGVVYLAVVRTTSQDTWRALGD